MIDAHPRLTKQIEDKLKLIGASETLRIEIMALVSDVYQQGYEDCEEKFSDDRGTYQDGYDDGYADGLGESMGAEE